MHARYLLVRGETEHCWRGCHTAYNCHTACQPQGTALSHTYLQGNIIMVIINNTDLTPLPLELITNSLQVCPLGQVSLYRLAVGSASPQAGQTSLMLPSELRLPNTWEIHYRTCHHSCWYSKFNPLTFLVSRAGCMATLSLANTLNQWHINLSDAAHLGWRGN